MKFKQAFQDALKNSWRLGILVALVTIIFAWVVKIAKLPTITVTASTIDVREQILAKGIAPNLGQRVIDLLQGIIPSLNITTLISLVIGSIILVFFGKLIVNLGAWKLAFLGRGSVMQISTILFYGMFVSSLILGFVTGIGIWTTLLAMFLYYIGVAIIIGFLLHIRFIERAVR